MHRDADRTPARAPELLWEGLAASGANKTLIPA